MAIDLTRIQAELNDEELGRDYAASEFLQGLRGDLVHGNFNNGYPPLHDALVSRLARANVPADEREATQAAAPLLALLGAEESIPQEFYVKVVDDMVVDGSIVQQALALLDKWRAEELHRNQQQNMGHDSGTYVRYDDKDKGR